MSTSECSMLNPFEQTVAVLSLVDDVHALGPDLVRLIAKFVVPKQEFVILKYMPDHLRTYDMEQVCAPFSGYDINDAVRSWFRGNQASSRFLHSLFASYESLYDFFPLPLLVSPPPHPTERSRFNKRTRKRERSKQEPLSFAICGVSWCHLPCYSTILDRTRISSDRKTVTVSLDDEQVEALLVQDYASYFAHHPQSFIDGLQAWSERRHLDPFILVCTSERLYQLYETNGRIIPYRLQKDEDDEDDEEAEDDAVPDEP